MENLKGLWDFRELLMGNVGVVLRSMQWVSSYAVGTICGVMLYRKKTKTILKI